MTDNEIIKALECCIIKHNCTDCPQDGNKNCLETAITGVLNAFNRQKAEIERLKTEKHFAIQNLTEEIKRLQKGIVKNLDEFASEYDEKIKAEAVREFAEMLKKELSLCKRECRKLLDNDGAFAIDKARKKLDNLLKETVGDAN